MDALINLIGQYGLLAVFIAVLLDQGGVPVPAWPLLVVASALAVQTGTSPWPILLVAIAAAMLADALWYAGGRRFGGAMLRLICRLSLSPDSCVATTRGIYSRWGPPSLVVAKFIPGVAAVTTTLAGQTRTGLVRFALYDGIGGALWAGAAIVVGTLFHGAVREVLAQLEAFGRSGLILLLAAIAGYVLYKFWRRQHFLRLIRMARISPAELHQLMGNGSAPIVLDVRPHEQRLRSGWIPGAITVASVDELDLAKQPEVVVYCDCPHEASAALIARQLKDRGFAHVRPLAGGIEAWNAHGLPIAHAPPADRDA
jgi:membrane protein DedA with SNARE-associated domain/rhodanese-related sulfurtransferase